MVIPISRRRYPGFAAYIKHNAKSLKPVFILPKYFPKPSFIAVPDNGVSQVLTDDNTKPRLSGGQPVNHNSGEKNFLAVAKQTGNLVPFVYNLAFIKRLPIAIRR
jgi:hypothetical protein